MFMIQSKLNNSVEKFEIRNYLIELLLEGNNSRSILMVFARYVCWHIAFEFFLHKLKCDPPWESREKGERTGTGVMTRHAKRVTYLSDMRICNKQNKECHGRYCFAC